MRNAAGECSNGAQSLRTHQLVFQNLDSFLVRQRWVIAHIWMPEFSIRLHSWGKS
jgi:hypothetical protein